MREKLARLGRFKYLVGFMAISVVIAAAGALMTKLSFWICLPISMIAVLANGLIATYEDDAPGGFNNPDGTDTPPYVSRVSLLLKAFAAIILILFVGVVGAWLIEQW